MTLEEFEKARQEVYHRVAKHKASSRPAIGETRFAKWERSMARLVYWILPIVLGLMAASFVISRVPATMSLARTASYLAMGGAGGLIVFWVVGFGVAILQNSRATLPQWVLHRILALWDTGRTLTPNEAKVVADMIEKHPPLKAICLSWLVASPSQIMTWREYETIAHAEVVLDAIKKQWDDTQTERSNAEEVTRTLNRRGLIDEASHMALDVSTENAPNPEKSLRRL